MGAVPRKKVTRHYRGNRRQHQRLDMPTLVVCPTCGNWMRAHRVCKTCGTYKGRQVILQKNNDNE